MNLTDCTLNLTDCILKLARDGFSVSLIYSSDSRQPVLSVSDFRLGEIGRYYIHSRVWIGCGNGFAITSDSRCETLVA